MDVFKILMLEGQFSLHNGRVVVRSDSGDVTVVEEALEKLEGRRVRLALMHVPPDGFQATKWGGGSCLLEHAGSCHAGHHVNPGKMFVFTAEGVLERDDTGWVISGFDGSRQYVPVHLLWGHYGRIVGATTDAVEKMRDALVNMDPNEQLDVITGKAGELRDMLDRLRNISVGSK